MLSITYRPIELWPGELHRSLQPSPFSADWDTTLELLGREVAHLSSRYRRHAGLGSIDDVELHLAFSPSDFRVDGMPRLDRTPRHPGAILLFEGKAGPLRFSCDAFDPPSWKRGVVGWRENVRAIALALEALRRVERYGLGSGTDHLRGFQALPAAGESSIALPSGAAMASNVAAQILIDNCGAVTGYGPEHLYGRPERIDALYKAACQVVHPDRGGDADLFTRVTIARDTLLRDARRRNGEDKP